MVKIKKVLVSALFAVMMLGGTSALASEAKEVSKIENLSSVIGEDGKPTIGTRAPAPPLAGTYVMAVVSPQGGEEVMNSFPQYSTNNDHGGNWIQVISYEIGYGHNRFTKFNGVNMKLAETLRVDIDKDGAIDATYYLWERDAYFTDGQFTTTATSINFPWNTVSAFINVK